MFICPKCKFTVEEVTSQICPHCKLIYFEDHLTTWIGSSLDCDIIFNYKDMPEYVAAITFNEQNKEYELINFIGQDFEIYKNRKKVTDKTSIDINDRIKIQNLIFDCNHPKINSIFIKQEKPRLSITYGSFNVYYTIGNTDDSDIFLEGLPSKGIFARILKADDSYFCAFPEDASYTPSIFLDDYKLKPEELKLIDENDNIYVEDVKLPVYKIPGFIEQSNPFYSTKHYPITVEFKHDLSKEISIGQSNCDIVIQSEKISYKHLTIREVGTDRFLIKDNNSYSGVYYGDKRIKEAVVSPEEVVNFGNHQLKIIQKDNSRIIWIDQLTGKIRIDALTFNKKVLHRNKLFNFKDKQILNNVSLSIGAGELVGIMGPSGSGKTTLLKMLAGVDRIDNKRRKGELFYNFSRIDNNNNLFSSEIGYLPQDDILFADLTVYECLYYSAKLRMPNLNNNTIDELIDKVLLNLNLDTEQTIKTDDSIKHRKIGSVNKPGAISGGQRKRINLAVELLSSPSILFLDEPTSGLSSVDSEKLMNLLVQINNMGNTIIATIHQPSREVFEKFNKLIVLSEGGNLAYFGPVTNVVEFFESSSQLKFDRTHNPADFILQALETRQSDFWQMKYEISELNEFYIKRHHSKIQSKIEENGKKESDAGKSKKYHFSQFLTLASRNFKLKFNNFSSLLLLLFQAPVIALLIGFIFNGPLFDGANLETDDKPYDDFSRINYYTQLSTYNKKYTYLPPYKKFFISFHNQTEDSLLIYSQIIDSSRVGDPSWSFIHSGPFNFSQVVLESKNQNAEEFPIQKGNYRFVISKDNVQLSNLKKLYKLNRKQDAYILDDSTVANNWYLLSPDQEKRLWHDRILEDRKKYFNNEEFNKYKLIDSTSFLASFNEFFDGNPIFESIKKYNYAIDSNKYGWYDLSKDTKYFYTSKKEYQEKSLTYLYLFFVMIISFIWIGMTNSVKDIVLERPIYKRERLHNLNLFTYIASKYFVQLIICIFQIATFLGILTYFISDLPIDFVHLCCLTLLTILISVGIGLMISALSNNIEFAISLLPILLIPQLLLAGVFKHIGSMNGFLNFISNFTVSRWSLESIVNAVSLNVDFESPFLNVILPYRNIIYPCYTPTVIDGKTVTSGYFPFPLEIDYILLFFYFLIVFVLPIIILKMKKND